MPLIVLVGRTNVGKSTLFNRLTRGRKALVAPSPGLTRDRRVDKVRREGWAFRVADTGGLEFDSSAPFSLDIARQVEVALREAAAVWMVVDASEGLTPLDAEIHRFLLKTGKPLILVVNKCDDSRRREAATEFYALGAAELHPVSAAHGSGVDEVLAATAARVPSIEIAGRAEPKRAIPPIRVALVGRPNVGKSSLVNAMLGESRMIVSAIPGTTREPVDVELEHGGEAFVLIDTAGLRRRARTRDSLERLSAVTSIRALERCDVAVLVIDSSEDIAEQDAKIAGHILEKRRAVVVALNKWDEVSADRERSRKVRDALKTKLGFLDFAAAVPTSAHQGDGISELFREIRKAHAEFTREIQTADLNRVIEAVGRHHAPPARGRSATRVLYGTQVSSRPPLFRFFCNHPELLGESYTRYFVHQLRYHFGLRGTPVGIQWRSKESQSHPKKPGRKRASARDATPARA